MGEKIFESDKSRRGMRHPELARLISQQAERLPAERVKNKIIKISGAFPKLKLKVGQEAPVFFLNRGGKARLEISLGHNRTAISERLVFMDTSNNWYGVLDQKGGGDTRGYNPLTNRNTFGYLGLLNRKEAEAEWAASEFCIENNVRSSRCVVITELEEIFFDFSNQTKAAEKASVADLKKASLLDNDFDPVILLRAFGTKERPKSIGNTNEDVKRQKLALREAKTLVADELGLLNSEFSYRKYLTWYAKTLGENVGRLHALGRFHNNLLPPSGPANVTLDCRLTDQDTQTEEPYSPEITPRDFEHSIEIIKLLSINLTLTKLARINILELREVLKIFRSEYNQQIQGMGPNSHARLIVEE